MDLEMDETTEEIVEPTEDTSTVEDTPTEEQATEEPSEEVDAAPEENEEQVEEPKEESYKVKAGVFNKETNQFEQKEFEIDKKFHPLMKDPESARLVKEIHEKAFGLDTVKERLNETRSYAANVAQENTEIKASIDGLRTTYQEAVKTGNLHKLDAFFEQLRVPQEVVINYAVAKAQLMEMPPEQRQLMEQKMNSERQAEMSQRQAQTIQNQVYEQARQTKSLQLEMTLGKPDISQIAESFDAQVGRPGAFKEELIRTGNLAWFQRQVDLSPEQAAQEVIKNYGLKAAAAATQAMPTQGQKRVVQKSASTIPNISSRGGASPVGQKKPKSIDDLKQLYKQNYE